MAKKATKKASLGKVGRVEREQRLNRTLVIGAIVIFSSILIILIVGLILNTFVYPNQPIAYVDGEEILTRDFQARVRFTRGQLIDQYLFYTQYQYEEGMRQIEIQLYPPLLGSNTISAMVDEIIIKHEAQARGIVVTDEEIEGMFEEYFSYYPEGTPTVSNPTARPTSTFSATQLALVTLPPTSTPTQEQTPEEQNTPIPDENEISSTEIPTATQFTYKSYLDNKQDYFQAQKSELDVTEKDLRAIFEGELYRKKLIEIIITEVEQEKAWVLARHILVDEEDQANEVLSRLENGEDWYGLAIELSIGPSGPQGGDLGWFDEAAMIPEVAFSLSIGEISDPVQSEFGWHIIQVIGREMRPLTPEEITAAKDQAFNNWLAEVREIVEFTLIKSWEDRIPNTPTIPPEFRLTQP